jgi:hypothetical protein
LRNKDEAVEKVGDDLGILDLVAGLQWSHGTIARTHKKIGIRL